MAKFVNQKKQFLKKWASRVVIWLVSLTHLKKTCQQKNIIPMNWIAIQYRTEQAQKLVVLLVSVTIFVDHECEHIHMGIAILCLKLERKQV